MYHGIDDNYISLQQFEKHLQFYQKHFELFWMNEAIPLLKNQCVTKTGKPPLILTFDDGLYNNFYNVAPLLKKYNIKATFYLVSKLLSGSDMLWNHEIRCRLTLLSDNELKKLNIKMPKTSRTSSIQSYVNSVKAWSQIEQQSLLNQLRQHTPDPAYTKEMYNEFIIMSLDNAKSLPSCIEIGSHSETHSILDTIPLEMAHQEICRSKKTLTKELKQQVSTFCYPNGNLTSDVVNIVRKRYITAVTVLKGFALPGDDLMLLKRIPATPKLHNLSYKLINPMS